MSSHLRKMGRRIMRKHKVLPSASKRHGIPFRAWTKIVVQMIEAKKKQMAEAAPVKQKSVAERLKEAGND